MPEPQRFANPYSALERFPPESRLAQGSTARPGLFPWWLSPLAICVVLVIEAYRRLMPDGLKRRCIYSPTCSKYGLESVKRYGALRGSLRTWGRIRRCNGALYRGGDDPP